MDEIEIFPMGAEDIPQVVQLENEIFSRPWSEESFWTAMDNPDNLYYVAKCGEGVVGYVGIWGMPPEGEVCNVAVSPGYRGRHIGKKLMEAGLEQALKKGITRLFLEVRASNTAAKNLYKSLGFQETGVRRGYYHGPAEDALLMELQNLPLDI